MNTINGTCVCQDQQCGNLTDHEGFCPREGNTPTLAINHVGKFRGGTVTPESTMKTAVTIRLCELCSRFHRRAGKCECEGCKHGGTQGPKMQGYHEKCDHMAVRVAKVKGWDPIMKQDSELELLMCEGCAPAPATT